MHLVIIRIRCKGSRMQNNAEYNVKTKSGIQCVLSPCDHHTVLIALSRIRISD